MMLETLLRNFLAWSKEKSNNSLKIPEKPLPTWTKLPCRKAYQPSQKPSSFNIRAIPNSLKPCFSNGYHCERYSLLFQWHDHMPLTNSGFNVSQYLSLTNHKAHGILLVFHVPTAQYVFNYFPGRVEERSFDSLRPLCQEHINVSSRMIWIRLSN